MRSLLAVYSLLAFTCLGMQISFDPAPQAGQANQTQGNSNQPRVKVTGRVLNSITNEPVGSAMVQFLGPEMRSVMTDAEGHFATEVQSGSMMIVVRRPGYESDRPTMTAVGSSSDPIILKLEPLGRISGTVLDSDGEPVEGIAVQCWHEVILNGRKQFQQSHGANTDETGGFEIEDLLRGRYYLATADKQLYQAANQNSEPARLIYPAMYYPDAASREMAQAVDVAAGQDTKIDMTLHIVRGSHVSFVTVPHYSNVVSTLDANNGIRQFRSAGLGRNGVLTFGGVAPGMWKIVVRGPFSSRGPEPEPAQYGELPIEVGSSDIGNLVVHLNPLADIPVQITGGPSSGLNLMLFSAEGMATMLNQQGDPAFKAITPGTYRLQVNSANACIVSAMSGTVDLLKEELTVAAGGSPAPIVVTTSATCPQVNVSLAEGGRGLVVAVRDGSTIGGQPFGINNQTKITLSPGDYRLYAFDDIENLEYGNPEAMRNFKSKSITVDGSQEISVQLEMNERRSK